MTPRKRATDTHLPMHVRRLPSGNYQYRGLGIIAKAGATTAEIWAAWQAQTRVEDVTSLAFAAEKYYESNNFSVLAERSQKDARECGKRPIEYFGTFPATKITPPMISEYLGLRFKKAQRRANLELNWFKQVYKTAIAVGLHPGPSPAADLAPLRLSREAKKAARAKKRLVSDADYQAMLAVVPDVGRVAMELAYCTGCRPGDVLKINRRDIGASIEIEENKTGREYSKAITPRLAAALKLADALPGQPFSGWVVRNKKGDRYTVSGFHANWKKWALLIPKHQRFTFQEIRIKAISEATGDKQAFSMHANARMLGIYDKTLRESPSHE